MKDCERQSEKRKMIFCVAETSRCHIVNAFLWKRVAEKLLKMGPKLLLAGWFALLTIVVGPKKRTGFLSGFSEFRTTQLPETRNAVHANSMGTLHFFKRSAWFRQLWDLAIVGKLNAWLKVAAA